MAKIQIETAKDGKTYLDEIEDTALQSTKEKLEAKGYSFKIVGPPLTEAQASGIIPAVEAQASRKESMVGGLLQGVSLGTEDLLGADKESIRLRQEAEHPYIYGASKFLGSLVPGMGMAAGGAALGTASPLGPGVGTAVGGAAGAGLAGLIESYASKETPPEGKGFPSVSDMAMGLISGVTEGVGAKVAPLARNVYRSARDKLIGKEMVKGATELSEISAEEIAKKLNIFKRIRDKVAANKKLTQIDDLLKRSDEEIYDELDPKDAADMLVIKRDMEASIAAEGGTNLGRVDGRIEVLENQLKAAKATTARALSNPVVGGATAALPMAVPDVDISEEQRLALQKKAIERAYYEAQRSKLGSAKQ
jgi:hypothetical protein